MNRNSNSNNFTPLPGARRSVARASYDNLRSHDETPVFYQSGNRILGLQDTPRIMVEDRTLSGRNLTPSFPTQPHRRQLFGEIVQQPPPRTVENPNSAILSKLKKEMYEPPKISPKRVSLCYKDSVANALKERDREKHERQKRCAVCLEDFEPREEVMLTPCKHLFHEDCIVPWVRSKGQCPVCRFVICEGTRDPTSSFDDNNMAMMGNTELLSAGELLSFFTAMQDALQVGYGTH